MSLASLLQRAMKINPGEGRKVLLLAIHSALAVAIFAIVQSSITALFLQAFPTSYLPYLFAGQSVFYVAASFFHSWITTRISKSLESRWLLIIFIFAIVASRGYLLFGTAKGLFPVAIILLSLVDLLMVQSSILVMSTFDTREAKRLNSVVNAGGTMGAVLGGVAVTCLTRMIGTENLLLINLPLLAMMIITGKRIIICYCDTDHPSRMPLRENQRFFSRIGGAVAEVLTERLLLVYLVIFIAMMMSSTIVDYQFKAILKQNFDKEGIARFIGLFFAFLNVATLLFQLTLASRILAVCGLVLTMAIMPGLVITSAFCFLFIPSLWSMSAYRFFENITKYTVFKDSSNLVFMPYPPEKQGRLKIVVNGIFRYCAVLGASLILILSGEQIGVRWLSLVVILLCGGATAALFRLPAPYLERLKDSLSNRRIRLKETPELAGLLDRQGIELVENGLVSGERDQILFFLELVRNNHIPVAPHLVTSLFSYPDDLVKIEALKALAMIGKVSEAPFTAALLASDPVPDVAAECLRTLATLRGSDWSMLALPCLESSSLSLRQHALALLLLHGDRGSRCSAEERLNSLLSGCLPDGLREAAWILGEQVKRKFVRKLADLCSHPDIQVRRAAVIAAGKGSCPVLIPQLMDALDDAKVRHLAAAGLARFGRQAIVPLLRVLRKNCDRDMGKSATIVKILGRIQTPEVFSRLVQELGSTSPTIRRQAIRSLNKINKRIQPGYADTLQIRKALDSEAERCRSLYALEQIIGGTTGIISPEGLAMFTDELGHRLKESREDLFRLLDLMHPPTVIYRIYLNYISSQRRYSANSLELLENLLNRTIARTILPLLEHMPLVSRHDALSRYATYTRVIAGGWDGFLQQSDEPWLVRVGRWGTREDYGYPEHNHGSGGDMLEQVERIFFLKSVPLFSELSGEQLQPLADIFVPTSVVATTVIFREGDLSDNLYLIRSGSVRVEHDGREVALLVRGDYFGDMALLDDEPRSATISAVTDCELLKLDKEDFEEFLEEYAVLSRAIMRTLSARLRGQLEKY